MKLHSYEWWLERLKQDEAELRELEVNGIKALSEYDIQIAHMGDAKEALRSAKQFKRNHIEYDKEQIAMFEKKGIQEKLL